MRIAGAIVIVLGVTAFLAGPAAGFWVEDMGHKMHFPQHPDPDGWDVNISSQLCFVGDDWECSQSGPVADIHLWASWRQDDVGQINGIRAQIYTNVPGTATDPSHPGNLLWTGAFGPDMFSIHQPATGDQGWLDPCSGTWNRPDHQGYFQINIPKIKDPFIQKQGDIYWLVLQANTTGELGWKTSNDHFMDDAAYQSAAGAAWQELIDPLNGQSLDLAFVITPEPATLVVLALGSLLALRRRRR